MCLAYTEKMNQTRVLHTDLENNLKPEDLLVASASEDGTVKLWHPLQVKTQCFALIV